jgi:ferredoxin-type protein NapH
MSIPSSAAAASSRPWSVQAAPGAAGALQRQRLWWQIGFFVLFVVAPVFDILRYDLEAGHAVILGLDWRLGLDDFFAGRIGATEVAINILLRVFLPIMGGAALLLAVAWRWGRLYCGWLCPHFSVVETINRLMRHASGRPSIWENKPLPDRNPDGSAFTVNVRWWLVTVPLAVAFAFVWAVVLLTYLLPPMEVYSNLLNLTPTRNQFIFITAGTVVLSIEFLFARHLFCRFGCAVGLFQSLAWMSNRGAMVIGFERPRAVECGTCYRKDHMGAAACEAVCPMRLKPRSTKNAMFTCTQCAQCLAACATVQGDQDTLLTWIDREAARQSEAQVSLTGHRDS